MRDAVEAPVPVGDRRRPIAVIVEQTTRWPGGVVIVWQHPVCVQVFRALPAGVRHVTGIVRRQDAAPVDKVSKINADHRRYEVGTDLVD